MSGDYLSNGSVWQLKSVIEELKEIIERQGKEKTTDDLYGSEEYYEKYPEERYYDKYPKNVQSYMIDGLESMMKAYVYLNRINRYLDGDDGDETFINQLHKDLNNLISAGKLPER